MTPTRTASTLLIGIELEASTILKTKKKKEKKRQSSGHYTTHEEVAEEDQQSGTEVRSLMEELDMAKGPDGAEVGAKTLGAHGLQFEVMEDLHGAQGQHGTIVEAGIITNDKKKPKKRTRKTRQAHKQRGAGRRRNADNQPDSWVVRSWAQHLLGHVAPGSHGAIRSNSRRG